MTMTADAPKSILVVDDDPWICDMLSDLLSGEGYTIREASTGKQGVQLAARYDPDVILLDLVMPDQSGLEVLDTLKDSTRTRDIPVIVLSGHTRAITSGAAARADGVIQKPFDLVELLQNVERATDSRP